MEQIKLNLGCGIVYMPGYINIDRFDSIADIIGDVDELPFKSNSVDRVEALQLIEHFDYIHSKYVLSEWFMVLKPGGRLILETPDLDKSFKKFRSADRKIQKTTLQWIYGIDKQGMQHKTGFTFKLLKELLEEIGFEEISGKEAKTHRYEPGMRIICKKPNEYLDKQLFASFRKKVKRELAIDESDILLSLENYCIKDIYENLNKNASININKIITLSAISNPQIPLIFCNECIRYGLFKRDELEDKFNLINYLIEICFHKKIFSLWAKTKKTIGKTDIGKTDINFGDFKFRNFTKRLESLLESLQYNGSDYEPDYKEYYKEHKERLKKRLNYIANLKPADIKIFNSHVVLLEARKFFNKGVREFHKKNFYRSLCSFSRSVKLNPENPLAYWNIARVGAILKRDDPEQEGMNIHNKIAERYVTSVDVTNADVTNNYKNSLILIKNKKTRGIIKRELELVHNKKMDLIPGEVISEEFEDV